MISKWRNSYVNDSQVTEFIEYFMSKWCKPGRTGWFDHYVDHIPITNNALESTNRYIKEKGNYHTSTNYF